jgi:hypothetical protein
MISIAPETIVLLRKHKAHQAELKLANRQHYHDHGLVFAKEWEHLHRHGNTLSMRMPCHRCSRMRRLELAALLHSLPCRSSLQRVWQ